jgi:hypothetical protein
VFVYVHVCVAIVLLYIYMQKKGAPKVRLELTTYRLTAGRAADCAIRDDHLNTTKIQVLHAGFEPATFGS